MEKHLVKNIINTNIKLDPEFYSNKRTRTTYCILQFFVTYFTSLNINFPVRIENDKDPKTQFKKISTKLLLSEIYIFYEHSERYGNIM